MHGVQPRPIDYVLIHGAQSSGASIGIFDGEDIPETLMDNSGRNFTYVGLAPRTWSGQLDRDALGPGEFIFRSGLVYRLKQEPHSWLKRLISRNSAKLWPASAVSR